MAAVKYAPPAMPPKKKYSTIIMPQSGALSMTTPVRPPAVTKREQSAQPDANGRANREQRVDHDVALRDLRVHGQVVRRGLGQEQEERVEPAEEPLLARAVEPSVRETQPPQRLHPPGGP